MSRRLGVLAVLGVLISAVPVARQGAPAVGSTAFETYIESLRQQAGIPGISGALVQDGEIVWERGLGFADLDARIPARPDTPYLVADLSQTLAAVLLLQCVEQRILLLDENVGRYGVTVPGGRATVRQLLSHSSTGTFHYDPERFALLTGAVEHCAPQPYRKSVAHRLLERLAMVDSVPGRDMHRREAAPDGLFEERVLDRYTRTLQRLAAPYRVDKKGRPTRTVVADDGIDAAAGLVSTVRDLSRFDAALDDGILLREETLAAAWTRSRAENGSAIPAGLGWFVQDYNDIPVVWHFGHHPDAYSALIVKVPTRRVTMILLANSDGLAVPFQLEKGDVTRSLFAAVFLRMLL